MKISSRNLWTLVGFFYKIQREIFPVIPHFGYTHNSVYRLQAAGLF